MITVTCPNCKVENSALSRRCISCGSELILEGYVRCDNCRALTPEKLEFCELCGSFLALVPKVDDLDSTSSDLTGSSRPPIVSATPSLSSNPHAHTEHQDKGKEDQGGKEAKQASQSPKQSDETADPSIPDWLLDVDAALKQRDSSVVQDDEAEISSTDELPSPKSVINESAVTHDELVRRLDISDGPEQPADDLDSQEWISALGGGIEGGETGETKSEHGTADAGAKSDESEPGSAAAKVAKTAALTLGSRAIAKRRRGATQPLDEKGNLLGVPQQLAGTDLPAWLRDQLQRPEENFEEDLADEIDLPEPTRSTFLTPVAPSLSEEETSVDETVLDPSFEMWLQEFSEEPVAPDWMDDDEVQLDETLVSDSVLTSAETPGWLHDIHQEEGDTAELLGIKETVETNGRLEGITGAIQIETAIAASLIPSPKLDYTLSKKHRHQIALLEGIVHDEPVEKRQKPIERPSSMPMSTRVILSGALVLVIIIAMLIPSSGEWIQGSTFHSASDSLIALHSQMDVTSGAPILVAFDYTPAMSGELNPIATTLLEQMAENQNIAITVSQSAAGSEVSSIVTQEVDGLETMPMGYLPGEAVGLRSLSECLDQSESCETLFGKELPADISQRLSEVAQILILTSESDSLIAWIEQVGSQHEGMVLLAGVTQTLGPLVNPYIASEQLAGVLVGLPDLVTYERDLMGVESDSLEGVGGFALTIWLVAGFLLAGTIYYALTGLKNSRSR